MASQEVQRLSPSDLMAALDPEEVAAVSDGCSHLRSQHTPAGLAGAGVERRGWQSMRRLEMVWKRPRWPAALRILEAAERRCLGRRV